MHEASVLDIHDFGVAYGDRVVLHKVNLRIPARGCTVLLGPAGTGKSTLLRTLAGFNDGNPSLRRWGSAIYRKRPEELQTCPQLVMQNSSLLMSNVLENLVSEMPDRALLTQRMQIDRVADLLGQLGQEHFLDCLAQKVIERPLHDHRIIAILRKLMANPALLLLDEPTAGLTQEQAAPLLKLIEKIAATRALLVALHHLQQARKLGGQVALLANGVIEEFNTAENFFNFPTSESAKNFIQTGSCPEASRADMDAKAAAYATSASEGESTRSPRSPQALYAVDSAHPARSAAWGPRGFLWLLPGRLAGTPYPGIMHDARYDLEALRSVGVTRLISLTEPAFDASLAHEFGIRCLTSPMPDMAPPTLPQGVALCETIDLALAAKEVVAVHCLAGLGRTGTVLTAYWLWCNRGSVSALSALEYVRQIEPGWVQSDAQVKFLEIFALVVANSDARVAALTHDSNSAPDVAVFEL